MNRRRFLGSLAALPPALILPGMRGLPDALVRLAGRCVLAGFRGRSLPSAVAELLRAGALAGVLVDNDNVWSHDGMVSLTRTIRESGREHPPVLIAADQEGGPVSHLSPPLPRMPSMATVGALDDVDLTRRVGQALGAGMRSLGVNFDLAPVLDVRTNRENLVVYGRAFGATPERVARHGPAIIEGLRSAGVLACAKHFPGHGDTEEDSHSELPRLRHPLSRLEAVELVPFRAVVGVTPAIMVAHVMYQALDAERPATLSRPVLHGLLRERLGYTGVAVTDDLEMAPIRRRYGVADAAVLSIEAGSDLVLIAHHHDQALEAIAALATRARARPAFGARLTEAATRVDALRARLISPIPPSPYEESPSEVAREVEARARGRGGRDRERRDPTR